MGTISGCIERIIIDRGERKLRLRMAQETKGKEHGKKEEESSKK